MRKRVFPRIIWLLALSCAVFILLVTMQFTRSGIFSLKIGDMQVSGRYAPEHDDEKDQWPLDGGVSIIFCGLEFRIDFAEFITQTENGAIFTLPGGAELLFSSHDLSGTANTEKQEPELRIIGTFPEDYPEINISFRAQRSSVARDAETDTLSILYNGSIYQFNRNLQGLDEGQIILSAAMPSISYRVLPEVEEFNPVRFIIPQAETAQIFSEAFSLWINRSFELWSRMGSQTNQDTVIAWCGESLRQNQYSLAVSVIPVSFSSDPQRTWESAVFQFDRRIGIWSNAVRNINTYERDRANAISRLLSGKDTHILTEKDLVEYLAVRNLDDLLNVFVSFVRDLNPTDITLALCPGILEGSLQLGKWRPNMANAFEPYVEQVCELLSGNLRRSGDQVLVFAEDMQANTEFNMRLGKALSQWGEKTGNAEWAGIGRSLALSVISFADEQGTVPALLEISANGELIPAGNRVIAARLYRIWGNNDYLPRAAATGTNGIWAWTASPAVNVVQSDNRLDIAISFPIGETHYILFRNIRPFAILRINDTVWRMASDFESYYDSSGWYYFTNERSLVLKIRHRSVIENVSIQFNAPAAPPPSEQGEDEGDITS